ncbi:MAG: spore coat protein [Ruminococcaceae bacterium]|nr:spore coat protein [Oscillospiraceae bacterium]
MDDRNLMENLLMLEKGACDLYTHGTVESATPEVTQQFKNALNDSLCMQGDIFKKMQAKGWYAPEQAEASKLGTVKQKFATA